MDSERAVRVLQALAHGHRLAIFRLLVRCGSNPVPAGEIAREIGIGATATSFHLKELDRAGLVYATRDGRYVRYAIHIDSMRAFLAFLTEDCCEGRPELCGGDVTTARDVCSVSPKSPTKR